MNVVMTEYRIVQTIEKQDDYLFEKSIILKNVGMLGKTNIGMLGKKNVPKKDFPNNKRFVFLFC